MGCLEPDVPEEKQSALELEQLRQAEERWQRFQHTYLPHEKQWIADTLARGSDAQTEHNVTEAMNASSVPQLDVAPNTGMDAIKGAVVEREGVQGDVLGAAGNAGYDATRANYEDQLQRIVGLGRNTSHMSSSNLNAASAIEAAEQASKNQIEVNRRNENQRLLGSAIGAIGTAAMLKRPQMQYNQTSTVPTAYQNNFSAGGTYDPNQYGGVV